MVSHSNTLSALHVAYAAGKPPTHNSLSRAGFGSLGGLASFEYRLSSAHSFIRAPPRVKQRRLRVKQGSGVFSKLTLNACLRM